MHENNSKLHSSLLLLSFAALGVVYGDIGTSPLYAISWALFIGCALLVIIFGSNARLASAYGLAVTGVMLATSIAMFPVALYHWKWNPIKVAAIFGPFALIDLIFLVSNSLKFVEGGYVPFAIGISLFIVMMTWRWGRALIMKSYDDFIKTRTFGWLVDFKSRLDQNGGVLTDDRGRAVELSRAVIFLTDHPLRNDPDLGVPISARLYIKHNGALPKYMVFLNISIEKEPFLESRGFDVIHFSDSIFGVNARYGFMEAPHVRNLLHELKEKGLLPLDFSRSTVQVAEQELIVDSDVPLWWRARVSFFEWMAALSNPAYRYFGLEADANLSVARIPVHITSPANTEHTTHVIKLNEEELSV